MASFKVLLVSRYIYVHNHLFLQENILHNRICYITWFEVFITYVFWDNSIVASWGIQNLALRITISQSYKITHSIYQAKWGSQHSQCRFRRYSKTFKGKPIKLRIYVQTSYYHHRKRFGLKLGVTKLIYYLLQIMQKYVQCTYLVTLCFVTTTSM